MADKYVPKKAAGGQTKLREWWNAVVESNFGVLYRAINDHFNGTDDRHTAEQVDYAEGKTVKAAIEQAEASATNLDALKDLLGATTLQIRIPGTVPGVIGTWLTVGNNFGEQLYKKPREFTVLNEVDYAKITARGWVHRENGAGCWCEVKENEFRVDPAFVPSESETEIVTVAIPAEDSGSQYQKDMLERVAALASSVLTKTNTVSYYPTGDYHPATKKYVDDAVAGSEPEYIDAGGIEQILTGNVLDQYVAPRGEMREYYVRYTDNRMSYNEYLTCKLYSMHYYIPGPGAGGYVQQLDIPFGTSGNGNSDPVSYIRYGDDDSGTLVWYEWEEQIPATKKYVNDAVGNIGTILDSINGEVV